MSKKPRECEMAKCVALWLRKQGCVVYAEIGYGPVDLVGYRSADDTIICIELKSCLNGKVICQAVRSHLVTPFVFVGIATNPRPKSLERCGKYGLGVLQINNGTILELLPPNYPHKPFPHRREQMLHCIKESTPSDQGGIPSQKGVGPAQGCLADVKDYVHRHPAATWKQIYDNVDNHYPSMANMRNALRGWLGFRLTEFKSECRPGAATGM